MNTNRKLRTLLVTSTIPGEGKSWVVANLAVTFAQAGKKVALIDADMRKGRVYTMFGVQPKPGLSNYLSISAEEQGNINLSKYLQRTDIENLFVMAAGNIPPNPSELLVSPQMRNLIEELKRQVDLVIIDGTPSKLVTDAVILSRIVDSTIIVSAHNQTKKDDLQKTVKDIKNVGGHIAGIVYNKMPVGTKKYNQTYYYANSIKPQRVRNDSSVADRKKTQSYAKNDVNTDDNRDRQRPAQTQNRNNYSNNTQRNTSNNRNNSQNYKSYQNNYGTRTAKHSNDKEDWRKILKEEKEEREDNKL